MLELMNSTTLQPKESSHIKNVSINFKTKKLFVTFKNNDNIYLYENVSEEDLSSFYTCDSFGKNLHERIYKTYNMRKFTEII